MGLFKNYEVDIEGEKARRKAILDFFNENSEEEDNKVEEKTREDKIEELKYWVNQDSTIGEIDNYYICQVERLCDELGISFDKAYELYEGEPSTFSA